MRPTISSIGTANPSHRIAQKDIAEFMIRAHQLQNGERERLLALYRATGIDYRYSVLGDYGQELGAYEFYNNDPQLEPFPTTAKRNKLYQQEALQLAVSAVNDCIESDFELNELTHLITVSCTGLYAPGLDIELISALELSTSIQRTAINFMGCYAAFNAIKLAQSICSSNTKAKVLVVCIELCSIHFQKETLEDFILSNALFGDGAAAFIMQNEQSAGLEVLANYGEVLPAGSQEMAWQVGDLGFEMRLSRYVPDLISDGIVQLTQNLLQQGSWTLEDIDYYAIHPGGKRILACIQQALNITSEQNSPAYRVLRQFGNMSSPTILFVLQEIWNNLTEEDRGKKILSFAFGPGLTMESMILQIK